MSDAPELAGQVASCPGCRGSFLMPGVATPVIASRPTGHRTESRPSSNRVMFVGLGALACIVLVTVIAAVAFSARRGILSIPAVISDSGLVAEFHGRGPEKTPVFTVKDDWSIEWECRGNSVSWVNICDDSGVALSQQWVGGRVDSDMISVATGGERCVSLAMTGDGIWRIRIRQGPGKITD